MKNVTLWPETMPVNAVVLEEFKDEDGEFYLVKLLDEDGSKLCVKKCNVKEATS